MISKRVSTIESNKLNNSISYKQKIYLQCMYFYLLRWIILWVWVVRMKYLLLEYSVWNKSEKKNILNQYVSENLCDKKNV